MTAPDPRPAAQGMTLVEILVVIVIIAILAGITFVAAVRVRAAAAESHTENVIRQLEGVFEQYREKTGEYPAGTRADIYASLVAVKLADPFGGQPTGKSGSKLVHEGGRTVVCDFWGTPLRIVMPPASVKNAPGPDIWSWGPNRKGSEDPAYVDPEPDPKKNTTIDDIRNWELR